jgi:short-subunit dehydrogenase
VITGGSDGIGLAMAKELATEQLFNICIVGRNESKMKERLKEIEELVMEKRQQKIKTMCVVADFAKMYTIQEYQDKVAPPLRDLDIAMIILNAGQAVFGPFEWTT